jgi:hypothetical protein
MPRLTRGRHSSGDRESPPYVTSRDGGGRGPQTQLPVVAVVLLPPVSATEPERFYCRAPIVVKSPQADGGRALPPIGGTGSRPGVFYADFGRRRIEIRSN